MNYAGEITIIISAKNVALHNFWSGSWRSVFTINVLKPGGKSQLNAKVKINVHYFEDGNVQLNTEFNQAEAVKVILPIVLGSNLTCTD
jgi:capping protein (actin filament) muscle Z-line, alpha